MDEDLLIREGIIVIDDPYNEERELAHAEVLKRYEKMCGKRIFGESKVLSHRMHEDDLVSKSSLTLKVLEDLFDWYGAVYGSRQ